MRALVLISILIISLGIKGQRYYKVFELPFNQKQGNEMAPAFYKDGLVFSSDRKNDLILVTVDQQNNRLYNLYYVEMKDGKWSKPKLLSNELSTRYNESSASFKSDGSMYFTRTLDVRDQLIANQADTSVNGIFYSDANLISSEEFMHNEELFDVAFPSISADGNTLYFAARNPEGYGGYDIYSSELRNGAWQEPQNLGGRINTPENEIFPFIHTSGRLYFSSRGHHERNDIDIFYSELIDQEWIEPVNLPRPFNSRSDEFGYITTPEMDTGFFTSNRRGSDDIFMFVSTFPAFDDCPMQIEESFCYEFSEAGSMVLDTTSLKYEWDFGDGNKVRNTSATHCFEEPGYYLVQMNVIDTLTGETHFSEASYDLLIEPIEQPYMLALDTAFVGQTIELDAINSNIKKFEIENYYWDFGDGEVGNEQPVRYSYNKEGTYYIKLGLTGPDRNDPSKTLKACSQKAIVILPVP